MDWITYNLNVFLEEHEEMLIVLKKEDLPFHILAPLLLAIINIILQELKKVFVKMIILDNTFD